jgi:hypothetical protein
VQDVPVHVVVAVKDHDHDDDHGNVNVNEARSAPVRGSRVSREIRTRTSETPRAMRSARSSLDRAPPPLVPPTKVGVGDHSTVVDVGVGVDVDVDFDGDDDVDV